MIDMLKVFEAQNCLKTEENGLKSTGESLYMSMIKILWKNVCFLVLKVPAPLMISKQTLNMPKLKGVEMD